MVAVLVVPKAEGVVTAPNMVVGEPKTGAVAF